MSERRHSWYLLAALALLLASFVMIPRVVRAAPPIFLVDRLDDTVEPSDTACNSDAADGDCSLRQAIERANNWVPETDIKEIRFTLFTDNPASITNPITVRNDGPLPVIKASNVRIIAATSFGLPQIEINANSNDSGLVLEGNNNEVTGLSIYGASNLGGPFRGSGVYIMGANNKIHQTFLGITPDGSLPAIRNGYGVIIAGPKATNNEIGGGSGEAVANYISGNSVNGVVITNASHNYIQNNFIGIKRVGQTTTLALEKNDWYGIQVLSDTSQTPTEGNIIGGPTSDLANIIGGNGKAGIYISGSSTLTTTIQTNFIGIYRDTDPDFGNLQDGIRIENGASGTVIGGATSNPLVISDNGGYGIYIRTSSSTTPPVNTTINGVTYIGTTRSGIVARGNGAGGVRIELAARNSNISGANNNLRISGNNGPGVWITGANVIGSQVSGALIGVNVGAGASAVANTGGGVLVDSGAQHTTITGSTISGNTDFGVRLSATKTVTLTGNFIGLDTARTGTVPNTGPGIDVQDGSSSTLIGSADSKNYLAGNGGAAIQVAGASTTGTTVSNNIIGLANNGSGVYNVIAGNTGDGVLVQGGARTTTVNNNLIGSNTGAGVKVEGSDTMTVTLSANNIGWVQDGNNSLERPNTVGGIVINQARYITATGNVLAYNASSGITATGVQTVTLQSNGVYYHSSGSGIEINGPSSNVQVLNNTLQSNSSYGVRVVGDSQRIRIQSNRISKNTTGGVKLEGTTRYIDSGSDDSTSLPNHGIDPPIVDSTFANPLSLRIDQYGNFNGWVYTDTATLPASACSPANTCEIQFFQPNTDPDGQGYTAYTVFPDSGSPAATFAHPDQYGHFTGRLNLGTVSLPKQLIFAVTDANGNTSEFGVLNLDVPSSLNLLSYMEPSNGQKHATPGETITYTLRLENNGTVDLSNAHFVTGGSLPHWTINPPNGRSNLIDLPAGSPPKTLTVTMTLPTGSDEYVRAEVADHTSVGVSASGNISPLSQSRILTTTVDAMPVVLESTLVGSGHAAPGDKVTHTHEFRNNGNVTVTLTLERRTIDPADSGVIWDTVLSANSLVIPPGETKTVTATITVPPGAQAYNAQGQVFQVTTRVTATAQAPFNSIVKVVSGITGVDLVPSAQVTGNGQYQKAAAFAEIPFYHNIYNYSNGRAHFCLNYKANSGSTVVSFTSQNSVSISGNCFYLDADSNSPTSLLRVKALVKVTGKLLPTYVDDIHIYLTDANTGAEIPNTSVTDRVEITVSPMLPAIWLPAVNR
ncbi:hypothetical protein EKD04_001120 [Chloroflexales bacterium ZM16-3]|nr:hypothetical protein [Chloroflexales bacterium ZM16-3]